MTQSLPESEYGDHQSVEDYMELDAGPCIVCGDWCEDTRCDRCKRNMEEDRLNRQA